MNSAIESMLEQYDPQNNTERENAIREIIQEIALSGLSHAGFFKKAIPVVGGLIGGSITFLSFGPCCHKLKETLQDTVLSNPDAEPGDDDPDILFEQEDGNEEQPEN